MISFTSSPSSISAGLESNSSCLFNRETCCLSDHRVHEASSTESIRPRDKILFMSGNLAKGMKNGISWKERLSTLKHLACPGCSFNNINNLFDGKGHAVDLQVKTCII